MAILDCRGAQRDLAFFSGVRAPSPTGNLPRRGRRRASSPPETKRPGDGDAGDSGQLGFSRPSRRAISASSDSRSANGSSAFVGALTLKGAFAFCAGGRPSPESCGPSGAGAEGCVLATGGDLGDAALAGGTGAAGGVERCSAFAAVIAESAFSERGGGADAAGAGAVGLPGAGASEALGGPFSGGRATGTLDVDPDAGTIGGGIAGRGGAGRGGSGLTGVGRAGSADWAAGGGAGGGGGADVGRPWFASIGLAAGAAAIAAPAAGARGIADAGAAAGVEAAAGGAAAGVEAAAAGAAAFVGGASATTGWARTAGSVRRAGAPGARRGEG